MTEALGSMSEPERLHVADYMPHVFWLFGLSGAGKSTLADRLTLTLRKRGVPVLRLDGDVLRAGLCSGLGFSEHDRTENLRRAAEAAKLGLESELCVIASFITPQERQRELIRRIVGNNQLSLIYVNASLEACRRRDVKGLYNLAKGGLVINMTGVSSTFDQPLHCALELNSESNSVEQCSDLLQAYAWKRLEGGTPQ